MKPPITLSFSTWTEQGIPFAETRRRMSERGDDECYEMYAVLVARGHLSAPMMRALGRLASGLRSTRLVLDQVEPELRALAVQLSGDPRLGGKALDTVVEGYALYIETLVRQAYKLLPIS